VNKSDDEKKIEESRLIALTAVHAVTEIKIIQVKNTYRIVATLTHGQGDFVLISYRKNVREWKSLDRLFKYLLENYKNIPTIKLLLESTEEQITVEVNCKSSD
jgi:hypothetical protein